MTERLEEIDNDATCISWSRECSTGEPVDGCRRSSRGSVHFVKRDLIERYRGRWVAVDESGDIVADADELGPPLERFAESGLLADTIQRVPGVGEPIFVGLS